MAPTPAAEGGGPEALLFVLAGIAIAIIVPYIIRRSRRATKLESVPVREQWNERKTHKKARHSADRILVDLAETSREISGRMDTKIRILNTLIRDAERCITRLEELQGIKPIDAPREVAPTAGIAGGNQDKEGAEAPPASEPTLEETSGDNNLWPGHSAWAGSPPWLGNSMQPTVISDVPELPATPPEEAAGEDSPEAKAESKAKSKEKKPKPAVDEGLSNGMSVKVVALLEEGFSVPEVARRLDISRREVKLIQALQEGEG
ncbi:MAG: hypothetical protein JXA52_07925 [Planctomycetes bacterium]|nr:hypothetical protein [Planctomycetota bacterium]